MPRQPGSRLHAPRGLAVAAALLATVGVLGGPRLLGHEQEFGGPLPGSGYLGGPVVPENGKVLDFPADGVTLLSWLTPQDISGRVERANDVWAYVSPSGREYAIVGLENGTAFVEVTDPLNPEVIRVVKGPRSIWRDMAVFGEHAYSVNETSGGVRVFDLSKIDRGRVRKRGRVTAAGLATVHNISVNEASGYTYLSGSNLVAGGLVALDLSDPAQPKLEDGTWPNAYVHDALIETYESGPYAGREIAFAFAGDTGLAIIDVTDKDDMSTMSLLPYPGLGYCHSGWTDAKRKYLYLNDELDELDDGGTTATHVIRIADLESPRHIRAASNGLASIDHNSMVVGKRLFASNYTSGLRVFSLKNRRRPREVAYFDTFPEDDHAGFNGAWGVHASLPSGVVLVSDIQRGLFVLLPD